ncbi:MAG: EpsI family protein [Candidatus Krumholzibacteriota bacterium]|nr:EpsI family protein [Candidatus Krumholzibacteriota bacterium]
MEKIEIKRLVLLLVVLSLLTGYVHALRDRSMMKPPSPDLALIPREIGGYSSRDEYLEPASLRLLGADATLARSYRNQAGPIELFLGYFASPQENSQIHSPKHCYPGSGWDILAEGSPRIRLGSREARVKEITITDGKERRLVFYWFDMNGETIHDEFSLKWRQMKSNILARSPAATFIRFSTGIPAGGSGRARQDLIRFIETLSPAIQAALAPESPPFQEKG